MYKYEKQVIEFLKNLKFVRTDEYFLRFELIEECVKYEVSVFRTDAINLNIILTKYENDIRTETLPCGFRELKNYFKCKLRLQRIEKLLKYENLDSKS